MTKPDKITLYTPTGGSMEVDDTPQRRAWAAGKGYTLDDNPVRQAAPPPPPTKPTTGRGA